jgi:FMN-dependent NADH-azoreductase
MAHILHIDSSPRTERSHSRQLSYEFITAYKDVHPNDTVTYRDLGHHSLPFVNEEWIAAAFTPSEIRTYELNQAIQISDALINEFLAADQYVFSIPMYNFSVPAAFKAYIDQIVRIYRTFTIEEQGFRGLVDGRKKMLIITTSGSTFRAGTPQAKNNFHEPYLRTVFGFIGLTDLTFVYADNMDMGQEAREQSLIEAHATIKELVTTW